MAALVFTPGTVFVLAVLAVLSVLAVRRIRSRGLCDSGPAPRGALAGGGTCSSGCASCAGCGSVDRMLADMDRAARKA